MRNEIELFTVDASGSSTEMEGIKALLNANNLELDRQVSSFVVCRRGGDIIACGGLDKNLIKDVAVASDYQGISLSLTLATALTRLAADNGHTHLFLCCQPAKVNLFRGWGFYPLAEVPDQIVLMENSPVAIRKYCDLLGAERKPGTNIGCIVLNANPFTLGHAYLVEVANAQCDWLHVFVVKENASQFSYLDRLALVRQGLKELGKLTIHQGSDYIISRATFPGYFLKEKAVIDSSWAGIDLLVFRNYIAPALGVTRRYVGTEPLDAATSKYNTAMEFWLRRADSQAGPVETVVVPRKCVDGRPVSASAVRKLLLQHDFATLAQLVPPSTLTFLASGMTGNRDGRPVGGP
ncbi:[citrate (pro-3S)-lyase] ligase [Caballeronia sp. dw_19]|uniref:[citrate (pro-3S)-lyase] ligase n=1 Tax=Caballeronia sp. dw_19 TaxID=2719791 RepID=UPI001BD4A433|nr:[citrate (pro-3S)-lyase] ligase [Caballeronia sp. dw_19]